MSAPTEAAAHVSFPPYYLSDVQLRYKSTVFHVHRTLLALNSKYFYNLFEKVPVGELVEVIGLPILSIDGKDVETDTIHNVLEFFYTRKIDKLMDPAQKKLVCTKVNYVAFYFQCEALETESQNISIQWLGSRETNLSLLWRSLYEAEGYHQVQWKNHLINFLSKKIGQAAFFPDESSRAYYAKISTETKLLLLAKILGS